MLARCVGVGTAGTLGASVANCWGGSSAGNAAPSGNQSWGCGGDVVASFTVGNPPTGAAQTTANATKGVGLSISLANADADGNNRTCQVQSAPTKGSYTLYSLPGANGWQLIVNKQTGQWGTEYNQAQDLARIPMKVTQRSSGLELFTISLDKTGADAGTLKLEWENTLASVDVKEKK